MTTWWRCGGCGAKCARFGRGRPQLPCLDCKAQSWKPYRGQRPAATLRKLNAARGRR